MKCRIRSPPGDSKFPKARITQTKNNKKGKERGWVSYHPFMPLRSLGQRLFYGLYGKQNG